MKLGFLGSREPQHASLGIAQIWDERERLGLLSRFGLAWHQTGQAVRSLVASPFTTILTVITIAVALSLLGLLVLFLENARGWLTSTRDRLTVNVYLREGGKPEQLRALADQVKNFPGVEHIELLTKEDALKEFRAALGDQATVLEGLDASNPLPSSLRVRFRDGSEQAFKRFADQLKRESTVESVQYDQGVLSQLGQIVENIRQAGYLAVLVVLAMTSFIIASTIRLALYARREETSIMRLVGATESFVRAPYLIEGSVQGALGAVLGIGVVYAAYVLAADAVQGSAVFQLMLPSLSFLSVGSVLLVMLSGAAVGFAGAYFAVRRFKAE